MPETFLHGVEVIEITDGARPIRTVRSSVIGLVGSAGTGATIPAETPTLVTSSSNISSLVGTDGYLKDSLEAIFKQAGAVVVVVRTTDPKGSAANFTGVFALKRAQADLGYTPRIIVTEGAGDDAEPNEVIGSVKSVAESLRAIAVVGLHHTLSTDATDFVSENGNERTFAIWPLVNDLEDPAAYVAGAIARSDNDRGFWWSPSNQEVFGINSLDFPVDFQLGDNASTANILNEGNVTTFIREGGFRLWGNRTGAVDPKWAFLSVRRTADLINDSILRAHLWAVDRNITKTYLEDVAESVNGYLRSLQEQGAILGGKCWPSQGLNTPQNIAQGIVHFDFEFTPPYPAEHIVFRSRLTNDYLEEILS